MSDTPSPNQSPTLAERRCKLCEENDGMIWIQASDAWEDCPFCRIDRLTAAISAAERRAEIQKAAIDRWVPCPDCRDKVDREKGCLACRAFKAERVADSLREQLALQERGRDEGMSPMFFPEESEPNQSPTLAERLLALESTSATGKLAHAIFRDAQAEIDRLTAALSAAEEKMRCTLGVGDGSGQLFVHGDHASIKAAQAIILERDSLREQLAQDDAIIAHIEGGICDAMDGEHCPFEAETEAAIERHAARKRAEGS